MKHLVRDKKSMNAWKSRQKKGLITGNHIQIKPYESNLLIEPMIQFRIRIKETDQISNGQKRLSASTVFAHLQPNKQEILSGRQWV